MRRTADARRRQRAAELQRRQAVERWIGSWVERSSGLPGVLRLCDGGDSHTQVYMRKQKPCEMRACGLTENVICKCSGWSKWRRSRLTFWPLGWRIWRRSSRPWRASIYLGLVRDYQDKMNLSMQLRAYPKIGEITVKYLILGLISC